MPRPRLEPGSHGEPWVVGTTSGFRAVVRVRDRDGRVREVTASATTKGAALRNLRSKLESRRAPNSYGVRSDMTMSELGVFWLDARSRSGSTGRGAVVRPQTLASYSDAIRLVLVPAIGSLRVGELTVGLLDSVLADLEDTGISTVLARSCLNQMLGLAVRHGALASNPMSLIAKPPRLPHEVEALTVDQACALRHHVDPDVLRRPGRRGPNCDLADFVDVALGTGARIGELLALRWKDLDLGAGLPTVTICGTLIEPRAGYVERLHRQESTKSGHSRTLILPDHVARLLKDRRDKTSHDADEDPAFSSRNGTWLWPNNMRTRLREALPPDLAGTTPHTLRRSVASRITHEVGLDAARDQLGHSAAGVTWQSYVAQRPVAPDLRYVLDAFFAKSRRNCA